MKSTKGVIPTNILIFIIGIILVIIYDFNNLMDFMIIVFGVIFFVPSMFALLSILLTKRDVSYLKMTSTIISASGAMFMGLFMLIKSNMFVAILSYIFLGLIILGGIFQIFLLLKDIKEVKYPSWLFAVPILMVMVGIISMVTSIRNHENVVVLMTGISFILFAVLSFIELKLMRSAVKLLEAEKEKARIEELSMPERKEITE